jgi:hypothetical protein
MRPIAQCNCGLRLHRRHSGDKAAKAKWPENDRKIVEESQRAAQQIAASSHVPCRQRESIHRAREAEVGRNRAQGGVHCKAELLRGDPLSVCVGCLQLFGFGFGQKRCQVREEDDSEKN